MNVLFWSDSGRSGFLQIFRNKLLAISDKVTFAKINENGHGQKMLSKMHI